MPSHTPQRRRPGRLKGALRALPAAVAAGLLAGACASMGRPEGGPRDVEPPVFVRSVPAPGALGVNAGKIELWFDENVQLENASEKVVVSPAQRQQPVMSANGRKVTVELRDTLLPATTYVIDFADAIKDLNEGNVLDGFAVTFSTGEHIDSLQISGMVLEAATLEPAQGMLVGAYLNRPDSAITTLPFDRITKTNQLGQFTLRGLAGGSYRVYALKDNNRDYHWDATEDVAFLDSAVVPYATTAVRADTLPPATLWLPNDVLLCWFNEDRRTQYLKELSRPEGRRLTMLLGAPADTLPSLTLLSPGGGRSDWTEWALLSRNQAADSLEYWIRRPEVSGLDTLRLEVRYQKPDSLQRLVWATDTLQLADKAKARKAREAERKSKHGKTSPADTLPSPAPVLDLKILPSGSMDLNAALLLQSATPIGRADSAAIHLEVFADSVWTPVATPRFEPADTLRPFTLRAPYPWREATKYRLTVDSLGVADIYGLACKRVTAEFTTRELADYSVLFLNVSGPPAGTPMVAELLNGQGQPVASAPVAAGTAAFEYINPGTYYARLYIDANANGRYDTGRLDSIQPEEMYYFPKALTLKKNWDIDQAWDIYATPLDMQKPSPIKKNKPPLKAGEQPEATPQTDDEDEDDTDIFANPFR